MKVVSKSKPKGRAQSTRKVVRRPRLAVVQLAEAQPDYEPELPDVSPEELPMEDRIRAAFGQMGEADHITVHLYRLTQNNKPEEYLFACGPDDLDNIMDRVRDACGSGTYRVRVYKNRRIATQFDFSVYVPPKAIAPPAPAQSESTALVQVLERMMERLSAPPPPQGDRLDDAVKLIGALKALQPAAASAPAFDASSMLTLLRSGFELFREMVPAGGGGDDDSVLGLVREGLKMLPSLLPMMQPGAQTALPAPAAQPEATTLPADQQPPQSSTGNPLLDLLRQPLAFLVTRAARNAPVEAAAEWTFSTLTLEGVSEQDMAALLERPDLPQVLMMVNPHVQAHGAWFENLIGTMRAMMFDEEPETETPNANVPGDSAADPKSSAA